MVGAGVRPRGEYRLEPVVSTTLLTSGTEPGPERKEAPGLPEALAESLGECDYLR